MLRATSALDDYIKQQTYIEQVWTGASIALLFMAAVAVYFYCACNQDGTKMMDTIDNFVMSLAARKQPIREEFEDYGAVAATQIGLDLDDLESPKEELRPQVWVPATIRQRQLARAASAPVFTVPLSPSDLPKKVW